MSDTLHELTGPIYVAADGRTVVDRTDVRVAFLKYGPGAKITQAQKEALIFPGRTSDPVPDAEQRSAPVVPDAEKRGSGRRKQLG